ncbi:hypothetical protein ABZ412_15745 [Nocardia sp. NPDC005746]|uniref:hypothetical protein n=1 Tax=Nocardia sp. NPDC005746 TaxID=3157062 RepID=UPI00340C6D63
MASRDIVVTVGEDDLLMLGDAAECAGMSVQAYVSWGVRLMALQARAKTDKQRGAAPGRPIQPAERTSEESESAAWTESFAQQLSHRADRDLPDTELCL